MKPKLARQAVVVVLLLLAACANQGTYHPADTAPLSPASACVNKIQPDICPAGTAVDVASAQGLQCGGSAGVDVKDQSGKVTAICGNKDNCNFTCKPLQECKGTMTLTLQKYECKVP